MSLRLLLILAAMSESPQVRTSPSSVIEGDQVTLSCRRRHGPDAAPPQVQFAIYRNERKVQEFGPSATYTVPSAQLEDSGNYTCAVRDSSGGVQKTGTVSIRVEALFDAPVIRNNQSSVTEGDEMTLTCDARRHPSAAATELKFAFYRDGRDVQPFSVSATYSVTAAQLAHSGNYTCEVRNPSGRAWKRSDVLRVQVEALFETPQIKNNRATVTEGDEMTLTCDTGHHPAAAARELEFAFHLDMETVQDFSASPTYSVPSAQLEKDVGEYTCEVQTPSGSVRKRSGAVYIPVAALFDTPQIRTNRSSLAEGDEITLVCDTTRNPARPTTELEFAFNKYWERVQNFTASATYNVPAAQLVHSGHYICVVRTPDGSVVKESDNALYINIHAVFSTPKIRSNWSPVIEGDEMTLTCDAPVIPAAEQSEESFDVYGIGSDPLAPFGDNASDVVTHSGSVPAIRNTADLEFAFYRDGQQLVQDFSASATYSVPAVQREHSGVYSCEARTTSRRVRKRSEEVFILVHVLSIWLFKQSLYYDVTESDEMTLTCITDLSATDTRILQFAFHRDWHCEQNFSVSDTYSVPAAQLWHSGSYTCDVRSPGGTVKRSDALSIQVKGLFSNPQIRNVRSSVTEGDNMTLTCDTRLYCVMDAAEPEFAFYRDGQIVQNFSASHTYSIPPVQLEDSGYYSCDVRMPRDSVRKRSDTIYIQIEEKGLPLSKVLGAVYGSLAVILLICVLLAWKCRNKRAETNTTAASTSKNDSSSTTYAVVAPAES